MIHYCEQWTDERHQVKKGMMSSSKGQAIGNCGKWLDTLVTELVADRIASHPSRSFKWNPQTRAWHELEPTARWLYELESLNDVTMVWFISLDEYVWCSTDWCVFDWDKIVWVVEVKSLDNIWHHRILMDQWCDSWHERQIQMEILVTGAEWCDFVAYNPNFWNQSLFIKRYYPDPVKHEKLKEWFEIWKKAIQKAVSDFNSLYKNQW